MVDARAGLPEVPAELASGAGWLDLVSPPLGEAGIDAPVNVKRAADHLLERLVTAIALGSFSPGYKLPTERELASRLQVSRATVRYALHRLEALGYIEIRRGRHGGAVVRSSWAPQSREMVAHVLLPRWEQLSWVFDLSHSINPLIARLAAQRRDHDDIERLQAAVQDFAGATSSRAEMAAADQAIHRAIALATHNPYFVAIEHKLRSELSFGTGALPYTEQIRQQALREHEDLARAIEAQDAARAARIALRHTRDLAEKPLRALYEQAVNPPEQQ